MPNFKLKATTPLNGFKKKIGEITICEVAGKSIVSMAIPKNGKTAFAKAIKTTFKTNVPSIGKSVNSKFKNARLLGLQRDQVFAVFDHDGPDALEQLPKTFTKTSYVTNQSDSWVTIRLEGKTVISALERICQIDLHPTKFKQDDLARTTMEHLGAIIITEKADSFLLMSASSTAKSFLHAITVSAENIA